MSKLQLNYMRVIDVEIRRNLSKGLVNLLKINLAEMFSWKFYSYIILTTRRRELLQIWHVNGKLIIKGSFLLGNIGQLLWQSILVWLVIKKKVENEMPKSRNLTTTKISSPENTMCWILGTSSLFIFVDITTTYKMLLFPNLDLTASWN